MSDTPNVAPAGAAEQSSASEPLTLDTAVSMWAELDEPEQKKKPGQDADAPSDEDPSEDGEPDAAAAEGDAGATEEAADDENDEDAAPANDAETEDEPEEEQLAHGNMRTRLRDGTVTTVGELKKLADEAREYKSKIPDLAATAQKVRDQESQLAQREQFVQQVLPAIVEWQNTKLPPEPSPSLLDESSPDYDPIKYVQDDHRRKLAIAEMQALHRSMQEHHRQQSQQAEAAREAEYKRTLEENRRLLVEKVPEIADPEKRRAVYEDFVSTAKKYNFTEEDVNNVTDYRVLYMVRDLSKKAAAYDKLMAQKSTVEKKTKAAAPVQAPGRRVTATETAQRSTDGQIKRWRDNDRSMNAAVDILASLE